MGLGLGIAEMFVNAAFESCPQLGGAIQLRGGFNFHRVEADLNARMPLVYL